MDPPELSIVMPCLNESETLASCIFKAQSYLEKNGISGEVIVADNGSTDGSQEIALRRGARLVHVERRGYGAALMAGILSARGRFVVMGDSDDSYDFSDLNAFIEGLRQGYDLVMGDRFAGGIRPGAMPFLHQYVGNPILSAMGRLFFHSPVRDFHCGLRGFKRDSILSLDLRTTGMEFASEMIVKASLNGLQIGEVPTILYPDGRSHSPHLKTWSDGWRHLRYLLLYSPHWLFLYPGLLAILAGGLVFAWLLPAPRHIGHVTIDVNTLLFSALAVLFGFQSVIFALFSMAFGVSEGLLPPDAALERILKFANLERGLIAGGLCIVIGVASSVAALEYWIGRSFGPLDVSTSMRLAIPGVLLFALGFQITLSSFFLSILGLKRL